MISMRARGNMGLVKGVSTNVGKVCLPVQRFSLRRSSQNTHVARGKSVIIRAQKQVQRRAEKSVKKAEKNLRELGVIDRLVKANEQLTNKISVKELLTQSLLASLTFGFAFQVTHNNGLLPEYDVWPFKIGPFLESGIVPFLLAPIWLLYGYLYPLMDEFFGDSNSTKKAISRASSLSSVGFTWVLAAAQFILSDILYLQHFPTWQIYLAMAACTSVIFPLTDRSKTGAVLGAVLAIGAPLGEAVCVSFGLWHYARPDNPLGVVFWTSFCYASYAYGVGNFARWQTQQQIQKRQKTSPMP